MKGIFKMITSDVMQKVIEVLEKENNSMLNTNRLVDNIRKSIEQEDVLYFTKDEAMDVLMTHIKYVSESDLNDGLAQMLSYIHNSNVKIETSKVYKAGKEVF
jgi:hypothetical protein